MCAMTENQWEMERRRLVGAVTRARNKAKQANTLDEKLEKLKQAKTAQESLRLHLLKAHDLISNGSTFDLLVQRISA